jgi:hypothetical protein
VTVRGDLALIVMAGFVAVGRTTWLSPSSSSMASVVSETTTVRVRRGGGPAGRRPRSRSNCSAVSGFGRVRSRVQGVEVEQQQGGGFDPDADLLRAGQDRATDQDVAAKAERAGWETLSTPAAPSRCATTATCTTSASPPIAADPRRPPGQRPAHPSDRPRHRRTDPGAHPRPQPGLAASRPTPGPPKKKR